MKMLRVTWMDAGGQPGWMEDSEMEEWLKSCKTEYLVTTIGFLWAESDEYLVLIRGWNGLGAAMDPMRIPREVITVIEELKHDKITQVTGNRTKRPERDGEESREPVGDGSDRNVSDYDSGPGGAGHL